MVSVIIPTRNAEVYMESLMDCLNKQSYSPLEVILVDSESTDQTVSIAEAKGARTLKVKQREFDHGGTRNLAARQAKGEYILFLSQDALPTDEKYVENLIAGFREEQVVMVSARQIPKADANPVEQLTRSFNYPEESFTRGAEDIPRLGIKAYFFSDVCSAYRKDFFETMGGFESPILTNEDMLMAARALKAGYRIGYCAEAKVYHSHNFSLKQHYRRNFDVAVFLSMYQNEIASDSVTGEGIRMVCYIERELFRHFHFASMFRCLLESAAKYFGNRAGKRYRSMKMEQIRKKTSNKSYWGR